MSADLHQDEAKRAKWEESYLHTRRNLPRRRRRIKKLVDASTEGRFLEIGSGDGLNLRVLRDLGFSHLIGMDYSIDLVRLSQVHPVLVGDGHALPFASDSIQTILVDSVLHHLTDYRSAADECHRILAPSGRLYFFEPRPSLLRRWLDYVTMSGALDFLPFFSSRRETLAEEWTLMQTWLAHHDDMRRFLDDAGLKQRYRKKGPIGMFLCFEKTVPGSTSGV